MASSVRKPTILPTIASTLERLRQLNTQDIQSQWQQSYQDMAIEEVFADRTSSWPTAPLNDRQHIAWERGCNILWLYQSITIPNNLHGYPLSGLILRLALTWWADDARIYIDSVLVQEGDLFECFTRLCLCDRATPGQTIQITIRLVSPAHDDGALVRSQLIYELPSHYPTPEPSFVADELTVLATLESDSQIEMEGAIAHLNWNSLAKSTSEHNGDSALNMWETLCDQPQLIPAIIHPFQQSLSELRRKLLPLASHLKQRQIQCVGHAHLDMAWLWPIADTWNAAERTFNSVLSLQKEFSELTFTHSSPALFEWIENNRPELFKQIQQKVTEGSWSIDAGLWIEPEFNIISGESIVRHILYGQRYCQEKFGHASKIAWLPDSFGFCWQLPQLLTQGGIETFATLKLSWNDTTEFPHQFFWWQSPDGSRIRSLMLPPIGSDIDPIKMATQTKKWESNTGIENALWLPGLGDHGGGPTQDMLEKAQRWENSPFFPELNFTSPNSYIQNLPLPIEKSIWNNELYLELHRGCYTTHADQKQQNRESEDLLYQAEVFATIAQLAADRLYPKSDLETAWKTLLFNQFHDILPGTSIPEVFVDANNGWEQVKQIGQRVLDESLNAIASTIKLPPPPHPQAKPLIVFNSLAWPIATVVTYDLSALDPEQNHSNWVIYNSEQQVIPHQVSSRGLGKRADRYILFSAFNIPAIGYQCYWIRPSNPSINSEQPDSQQPSKYILENKFIKASIDSSTGQIASLIEKSTEREALSAPGNQLQIFQDNSGYWDAWNIASDYKEHPLPEPKLCSIEWISTGSVRQTVRVTYETNCSSISQDYILNANAPFLTIENCVCWHETQVLLKVNFPLTHESNEAVYEIPFGAITRTTHPQTEAEKAKWEVPALRWADISNEDFGVSILTIGKHGFDASPNHLRLTLLKSPIWPDLTADKGIHHFTYAIYPHPGSWQTARTVQYARAFNIPPVIYQPEDIANASDANGTKRQSYLRIQNDNIVLSSLKPTEERPDEFVLRCYEAHGETSDFHMESSLDSFKLFNEKAIRTNLLEIPSNCEQPSRIKPWQVATYRLKKKSPAKN